MSIRIGIFNSVLVSFISLTVGEQHQKPESIRLIQNLVTEHLQQNRCLILGLEINSDQQPVIDRVMQGRASVSEIEISTIIDHPPLRTMIDNLASISRAGAA